MARLTSADLERELIEIMRSVASDPEADGHDAERRFLALRRKALRRGWRDLATSCLVQARMVVGLYGGWEREIQILRQLVREAPTLSRYKSLGAALQRRGRFEAAIEAYETAIELATPTERGTESYAQAVTWLSECRRARHDV